LVHEITHILEGLDCHSGEGVMKAHWTKEDHGSMIRKPLPFTREDIDLIHVAMAARAPHAAETRVSMTPSEPPGVAPGKRPTNMMRQHITRQTMTSGLWRKLKNCTMRPANATLRNAGNFWMMLARAMNCWRKLR
jgi:hypothetical protein